MCNKFGKAKAGDRDRRAFLQASVAVATIAANRDAIVVWRRLFDEDPPE